MSTITTLNDWISGASFRWQINTNFANLNADKAELSGATFTGDISVPAEVYGAGWNGSNEVPTKNDLYDKIETIWGGGSVATDTIWDAKGDLAVGTGANTASRLAVGTNGQILVADSAEATGVKWANASGGGDMLAATYDPANIAEQLVGLTATQTFSTGVKTFLAGMFGLRNVANTFTSFFTNTNTASRTYTLKDANGTLAFTSDITGTNSGTNTGDETTARINTLYGTTNAITVGSVELGNASDTTLSRSAAWTLAVEGIRVRTTTPLVVSAASYTTDTGTSLNMDNLDEFIITAQAGALLFNAPGGTLVQGRTLIIRIKDNGTARALTWDAVFRAMGTALPSTTVLSKTLYLGFKYNSTDSKFDLLASAQEA